MGTATTNATEIMTNNITVMLGHLGENDHFRDANGCPGRACVGLRDIHTSTLLLISSGTWVMIMLKLTSLTLQYTELNFITQRK